MPSDSACFAFYCSGHGTHILLKREDPTVLAVAYALAFAKVMDTLLASLRSHHTFYLCILHRQCT